MRVVALIGALWLGVRSAITLMLGWALCGRGVDSVVMPGAGCDRYVQPGGGLLDVLALALVAAGWTFRRGVRRPENMGPAAPWLSRRQRLLMTVAPLLGALPLVLGGAAIGSAEAAGFEFPLMLALMALGWWLFAFVWEQGPERSALHWLAARQARRAVAAGAAGVFRGRTEGGRLVAENGDVWVVDWDRVAWPDGGRPAVPGAVVELVGCLCEIPDRQASKLERSPVASVPAVGPVDRRPVLVTSVVARRRATRGPAPPRSA